MEFEIVNTKNISNPSKIFKSLSKIDSNGNKINLFYDSSIRVYNIFENARQMVNALNSIDIQDKFAINFIAHQSIELCKKSLLLWADNTSFNSNYSEKEYGISTHILKDICLPDTDLSKILKSIENKLDGLSNVYLDYRFGNNKTINSLGFKSNSDELPIFTDDKIIKLVNLYYLISLFIMKDYFICLRSHYNGLKNRFIDIKIDNINIDDINTGELSIIAKIGLFKITNNNIDDLGDLKNQIDEYINKNTIAKVNKFSAYTAKAIHIEMLCLLSELIEESLNMGALTNKVTINQSKKIKRSWILYGIRMEIDNLINEYEYEENMVCKKSIEYKKQEILISFYRSMSYYYNELSKFIKNKYNTKDIEYLEYIVLGFNKIISNISKIVSDDELNSYLNNLECEKLRIKDKRLNSNFEYIFSLLK